MAAVLLILIISSIGAIFWYQAWVYSLPTEVPAGYKAVDKGTRINLEQHLALKPGKPVFIHFFNPECPCSRFNMKEFRAIAGSRSAEARFVVVVLSPDEISAEEVKEKYDLDMPVVLDKSLAKECGVYSTPQAVVLDGQFRLHYRGNYNRSRYCTDSKTSYARIALDQLAGTRKEYAFGSSALKAYGCSIDNCREQ